MIFSKTMKQRYSHVIKDEEFVGTPDLQEIVKKILQVDHSDSNLNLNIQKITWVNLIILYN